MRSSKCVPRLPGVIYKHLETFYTFWKNFKDFYKTKLCFSQIVCDTVIRGDEGRVDAECFLSRCRFWLSLFQRMFWVQKFLQNRR